MEGRKGGEGGGDILIYSLKVGSLYHPFEYMHILKKYQIVCVNLEFIKICKRPTFSWKFIKLF